MMLKIVLIITYGLFCWCSHRKTRGNGCMSSNTDGRTHSRKHARTHARKHTQKHAHTHKSIISIINNVIAYLLRVRRCQDDVYHA